MQIIKNSEMDSRETAVKAVFFDIDGTLVSFKTHTVPPSAVKAIKALQEKGIKVIVATGRSIKAIDHIRYLNFDGFITFNGGYCVANDGRLLLRKAIDPTDIQRLLDHTTHHFALMYEKDVFISHVTPEIAGMYAHLNLPVPPLMNRERTDVTNVLQANIFMPPDKELEFMKNVMPNSLATRWTPLFADVNPGGSSKKVGVEIFCDHFGFDASETMSFGDGGNDISMLMQTGIGVAMGNANKNVKEIADFITTDTDTDGVFNALVHYNVI